MKVTVKKVKVIKDPKANVTEISKKDYDEWRKSGIKNYEEWRKEKIDKNETKIK